MHKVSFYYEELDYWKDKVKEAEGCKTCIEDEIADLSKLELEASYDFLTEFDQRRAAQIAGDHWFHERDGWESTWPVTFILFDDKFKEIGVFIVDCESVPEFVARKKKE